MKFLSVLLEDAVVLGKAHFLNFCKSTLGNVYISLSVDTLPSWVGRCDALLTDSERGILSAFPMVKSWSTIYASQ